MKFTKALERTLLFLAVAILGCLTTTSLVEARPNVGGDLLRPGVLIVGSDIPYPPFEFGRKPHYKGFDVDLVHAMARKLRLRVRFKDTYFDTIFTDQWHHKFDLTASAVTITPERSRVVSFSRPYYDALQSLVVRRRSRIDSLRDLAGRRVGVQGYSSGDAFASDETRAEVVDFVTPQQAMWAVTNGRVRAAIVDQPAAKAFLRGQARGLKIARNYSAGNQYGFATKKSSHRLLRGINWALRKIKADGSFRRIYRKWFGINPPRSLRR